MPHRGDTGVFPYTLVARVSTCLMALSHDEDTSRRLGM